jgi:putative transposase
MIYQIRKRTEPDYIIAYSLYLYSLGLSLRSTSKAISRFIKRSHSAIREWIQKYQPEKLFSKKTKISEFIVDETVIKMGRFRIHLALDCYRTNQQIRKFLDLVYQKNKICLW